MQITPALLLLLPLGLGLSGTSAASAQRPPPSSNAVLLSSVRTLTLRGDGAKTTHRRVRAIPQLRCVAADRRLCALHQVDLMRCTNQGSSYGDEDVEWSCEAALPPELRLGATDVVCEGYAGPDDPYVLRGSCGVEYTLALTDRGERRYPHLVGGGGGGGSGGDGMDAAAWLFALVFVAVFAWIAYSACVAGSGTNNRRQGYTTRRYGGGGGGGGGGDGPGGGGGWGPRNDPPPPYPGPDNSYKPSSSSSSGSGSQQQQQQQQQQQGWRPGFWTGLASGAAASYLAGGRNRDNNRNNYSPWGGNNYYGGSGSRWGGGDSWAGPSSSSGRARGGSSGERHESTGFGSTRRR